MRRCHVSRRRARRNLGLYEWRRVPAILKNREAVIQRGTAIRVGRIGARIRDCRWRWRRDRASQLTTRPCAWDRLCGLGLPRLCALERVGNGFFRRVNGESILDDRRGLAISGARRRCVRIIRDASLVDPLVQLGSRRRHTHEDRCGRENRRPYGPGDQSHAGARPFGLAIRPSARLSALIRDISSPVSSKSKTSRLSAMCLGLAERGIAAMLPCCMSHLRAI